MKLDTTHRQNGFGALRLLFASLVILAHCPYLLDGNRSREPLTQMFHTSLSFGVLAVDGFFLISGYLIAQSFLASPRGYFRRRAVRIYPAFIACSIICALLVGPLVGGLPPTGAGEWWRLVWRMALLQSPISDGALAGTHNNTLDGSMWTIAYEFRCYVLVALLGWTGLLRRRWTMLALTSGLLFLRLAHLWWPEPQDVHMSDMGLILVGQPSETIRLTAVFMVGICFQLFRPQLKGSVALACAFALLPLMYVEGVAEVALVTLGAYGLFWMAFEWDFKPLKTINAKDDISYGVYLYAWPITSLVIWYWKGVPLWALDAITFAGALACGALSWFLLEKRALKLKALPLPAAPRRFAVAASGRKSG
jgi:peptidoglycan/LPS O-acetylase OafA/YrhL